MVKPLPHELDVPLHNASTGLVGHSSELRIHNTVLIKGKVQGWIACDKSRNRMVQEVVTREAELQFPVLRLSDREVLKYREVRIEEPWTGQRRYDVRPLLAGNDRASAGETCGIGELVSRATFPRIAIQHRHQSNVRSAKYVRVTSGDRGSGRDAHERCARRNIRGVVKVRRYLRLQVRAALELGDTRDLPTVRRTLYESVPIVNLRKLVYIREVKDIGAVVGESSIVTA